MILAALLFIGRVSSTTTVSRVTYLMSHAEFHRHVGAENILSNVTAALARAEAAWRNGQERA